ncbi:MAG: DUF992 domain-containing protein [Proteobacteria bacterium]|nr:DUF992 domain-containing protein [Pseudomonadota bacterium]
MIASVFALTPQTQAAQSGVRIGVLTCHVRGAWGHLVASSRRMNCVYEPYHRRAERYIGTLSRYGVDVGRTNNGTLVWAVVAPTSNVGRTALEGSYGGLAANATIGVGAGANVLVGGLDRSIALQPLSVEGNSGLALAAGVGVMRLRAA